MRYDEAISMIKLFKGKPTPDLIECVQHMTESGIGVHAIQRRIQESGDQQAADEEKA